LNRRRQSPVYEICHVAALGLAAKGKDKARIIHTAADSVIEAFETYMRGSEKAAVVELARQVVEKAEASPSVFPAKAGNPILKRMF
jgi:hypothetical protein